jgi:branched-chain amino acid transport system ATP-binding protein
MSYSGPPDSRTVLEIAGLSKSFGSVRAADGIVLAVREGEALGIIGPNGAGKSSLFNLVTGDLVPDAGEIRLNGHSVTRMPPHRRCKLGIARSYQIPHPFENLTVFENLLVGAAFGQDKQERDVADICGRVLEQTGLLHRADVPAGSLTLLERKRLELARALATGPQVLLLDEIAGGLTEGEIADLVTTIREINASGTTIVWIEHVVAALLAVVTRLVVLNFGRKIAEGHPQTVMNSKEVREIYTGIEA